MSEERDAIGAPEELDDLEQQEGETETDEEQDSGLESEDEQPEGDEPTPPARTETRRPGRRERQSAELRELRERSERTERELRELRSQQQQQPQVDRGEQERVAAYERDQLPLQSPDQIARYWSGKTERTVAQALQHQQFTIADQIDRSAWESKLDTSPRRQRFASQVEDTLRTERAQGRSPSRETIYRYLLGDEIERQAARQVPGQRAAAQRRVRAQTTRPGGSRSDAARERLPAGSGDDYESALARIRGKGLW